MLFAGTIGDNIAYGLDPDILTRHTDSDSCSNSNSNQSTPSGNKTGDAVASSHRNLAGALTISELRERIIEAAKLANAHDFIMSFPQQYDTDVGANGVAMSGKTHKKQHTYVYLFLNDNALYHYCLCAYGCVSTLSHSICHNIWSEAAHRHSSCTHQAPHRLLTLISPIMSASNPLPLLRHRPLKPLLLLLMKVMKQAMPALLLQGLHTLVSPWLQSLRSQLMERTPHRPSSRIARRI